MMKRWIAWILCLLMTIGLTPAALAEETEKPAKTEEPTAELGEAAVHEETEDVLEVSEDGMAAPTGMHIPESGHGRKSDPAMKETENGEPMTFALNDGIVATMKDGVMTITGTGEVKSFSKAAESPWYGVRDQIVEVVVEEGVTGLGSYLFWDCKNLTSIQLPEGLTYLYSTFCQCTGLTSVTLPDSVTCVGTTFAACSALESVTANGLENIGEYSFQGTAIKSYTLPKTLKVISPLAFWDGAIESFDVEEGNATFTVRDAILFTEGGKTLVSYPAGRTTANVKIPAGAEAVGESAFASNRYLKQIDFSDVTTIGFSAFTSCHALESLTIPDTVTEMGACAFENCENLKSVKFGKGLEKTGYRTFARCKALTTIDFGTTLNTIEGLCFAYCDGLKNVTLPETITTAENGSFGECHGLESFTTTALTIIPYQILLNDDRLQTLTLNDGITRINRQAFYGTASLREVDVPASVQFIDDYGFDPRYTTVHVGNPELDPFGRSGWRRQEYITVTGVERYDKAFEVLDLVNQERTAAGLNPLVMDEDLTEYAMQRAMELAVLFSHTRPDGSAFYSPYMGSVWGENAAEYQQSAAEVMDAWMNSEGHRENIMQKYYDKIGVGCVEVEGRPYWIQWFARYSANEFTQPANRTVSRRIGYAIDKFEDAPQTSGVVFYFTMPPEYDYVFETDRTDYGMNVGETTEIIFYLRGQCVSEKGRFLNARVTYPANELNWSIDDTSVASIDNGVLTAKKNGKATVTIRTKNGYFKHTVRVSVGSLATAEVSFAEGEVQYRGTTPYVVADGTAKEPKLVVRDGDGVVDPSRYTVVYRSNVDAGTAYADITMKDTGETRTAWFKIYLPPTTGTTVVNNGVPLIRWDPVPGAKGYVIYRRAWNLASSGWTTFERWNNTTNTYFYDRKVYAGTRYQYGVKAYFAEKTDDAAGKTIGGAMDNYNLGIVGPLKTIVYITQREITNVTPGKGTLTVTWDESKVFTGYQVQILEGGYSSQYIKATVKITDPKTHEYTFRGLKSGKTYHLRVRSYQVFEGMTYFGSWSYFEDGTVR